MNKLKSKCDNARVYQKTQSKYNQDLFRGWLALSITTVFLIKSTFAGFACLSNPCIFGVCIDDLNSTYSCFCIDGYTGIQCQTNWDECWDLPCENGGTCIDGVAQYNCSCPEGFIGLNCEENLDECLSNPCQNGGMCHDHANGYTCTCLPGYLGIYCETDIAVCETGNGERCHNGGECLEGSGLEFSCKCIPGWQGRYCDDEIDECASSPCQNGAVCVDKLANYACACVMGFTGINCEEAVLLCEDSPCYNNALCLMEEGQPVCYCVPDYHGEKCELQYDECKLGPRCINGGTCIDGVDNFTCSCPPQLSGILCECLELTNDDFDCNFIQPTILTSTVEWIETTVYEEIKTTSLSTKTDITDDFFQSTLTTVPTIESSTITIPSTTLFNNNFSTNTDRISYTETDYITSTYYTTTEIGNLISSTEEISLEIENKTIVNNNTTDFYETTETPISATEPTTNEYSTLGPFFTNYPTEIKSTVDDFTTTSMFEETTFEESTPTTNWGGVTTVTTVPTNNITKNLNCMQTPCLNGGTCVNTSEGSRCVCRFDNQGHLCELDVIISNAAFASDSYISHKISSKVFIRNKIEKKNPLSIQIELKARTRAMDGLIILMVAQGNIGGHYLSLFLHRGLLQFQFSCGLQTMLLSELETPVNTGNEILIQAELDFSNDYSHCNASLRVNKTLAMSGDQPTWLILNTKDKSIESMWLHLGNVSPQTPYGLIKDLPTGGQGFTGCLHSMKINNESRNIFSDAIDGFEITECGSLSCLSNPCQNGASCIEEENNKNDKNDKWQCKCPTGYMGVMCEISVCDNNPCQYGGSCVTFPGSGYLCLCPLGKHGHYCEHNLEIAQPSFSGSVKGLSSYIAYPVPFPIEHTLEISFKIRPTTISQISLIGFLGQNGLHDESSDHLAISFIQGYIMLTWNLGNGPRRIFTQKPLDIKEGQKQTFEIRIGRNGRQAWLSVDGKNNITGRSQESKSRLNVNPVIFIGGHELGNFSTLPHDLPLHSGFQGCIFDLRFISGSVSVSLQDSRDIRGRGVGQCETKECHKHACQNEGACLQYGATFTCICQDGWYGPLCAQSINVCDSSYNKCSSGSSCIPLVSNYECDCATGKTGRNCNTNIVSLSDVSLTGRRSYLSVKWPETKALNNYENAYRKMLNYHLLNRIDGNNNTDESTIVNRVQYFSIELQIRPLSEKGIILFFGALEDTVDKYLGFASISLQGGIVEFRLGGGDKNHVTILRSARVLAIGEWHKIKVSQNGKRLYLMVEDSSTTTILPSGLTNINQKSLVYIGGLPNLSKLPYNAVSGGYPVPFRGCVRKLILSKIRIVLNETNILDSRNINDCDGTSCGGDTCDLGGHCWLDEKQQPHCKCPQNTIGDRCELHQSCNIISCKNQGVCLSTGCSCLNGWGGFYCEIATNKLSTPSFNGLSYIVIPPLRIPLKDKRGVGFMSITNKPKQFIQLSLNFSTITEDGLLVWSSDGHLKYFGLGIERGYLKLASNLLRNNSVSFPTIGGCVSDGDYHNAQIYTDKDSINLKLNGKLIFSEYIKINESTNMDQATVTLEDKFYIGGVPNTINEKLAGYNFFNLRSYRGCIRDFSFGNDSDLQIEDFSVYEGQNIGVCDSNDEFV